MTEAARQDSRASEQLKLAIVTPSWNRRNLLEGLYESLVNQVDTRFEWVVVDDASTDGTSDWVQGLKSHRPAVKHVRNEQNLGKCASLNRAFAVAEADFYLVVDSDDTLLPSAVDTVKSMAAEHLEDTGVGAIFFSYRGAAGDRLQSAKPFAEDLITTRAKFDSRYGKFDGCVGYFRRVVRRRQYPVYPSETYVGPTVLQLLMAPEFEMRFTHAEIGTADYQDGGLTANGRPLRLANPLGMMEYSRLQCEQAESVLVRLKNATTYYAYRRFAPTETVELVKSLRLQSTMRFGAQALGWLLATYWRRRFRTAMSRKVRQ